MASEMTTAEMVDKCKRIGEGADERLRCKEAEAISTRLAALDKVAKAADRLAYGKLGESGDYWVSSIADLERLHAALKEAGYGK